MARSRWTGRQRTRRSYWRAPPLEPAPRHALGLRRVRGRGSSQTGSAHQASRSALRACLGVCLLDAMGHAERELIDLVGRVEVGILGHHEDH